MKPVLMEKLTAEVDSYRAALASLLDLDLDVVPGYVGMTAQMQWDAWMATELNLSVLRLLPGVLAAPPPGYWLGRFVSPYPGYQAHTVVCMGALVVHDPHPEPQELAPEALALLELLLPMDPAAPFGRDALTF